MKKYLLLFFPIAIAFLSMTDDQKLASSVYEWDKMPVKKSATGEVKDFFSSPSRSLDMFTIQAITLSPGKNGNSYTINSGTDELIIVKEGTVEILVDKKSNIMGEGSVFVASPGDKVYITNPQNTKAVYYFIGFKPYKPNIQTETSKTALPLFIDWKNVEFKPAANGGRRNIMQQKTASLKELEIHVTTLKEGLPSHSAHVHPDEEIILVRKGFVEQTIKGQPYRLGPGSIIFLTNDDLHGIGNAGNGECEYYAIRWLTE